VNVPDQVPDAKPSSRQKELGIMDNNHVMLLRQRLQDRASRTPRLEPTPTG
jgi:hypothetical protein